MRRCGRALEVAAVLPAWAVLCCGAAAAADMREIRGAVSARVSAARLMQGAEPDESLPMSITLKLRQRAELQALLDAQHRPGAPEYHRWLSPYEFAARFGPSPRAYAALADWLRGHGFDVRTWPSRARIDFSGTVGQVERAFLVRMNRYQHRGRAVLANADAPRLPARLADAVAAARLNTFPLADPLIRIATASGTHEVMAPADMYTVYNLRPLLDAGTDGTGQTVAVVARADFKLSDVTQFQQQFGVPVRRPTKVFPTGNPGVGSANGVCREIRDPVQRQDCIEGEEGEVLLDVEWAGAMAPGAAVLVDISNQEIDGSFLDIVTNHPEAKVITLSFGTCERLDPSALQIFAPMYAQAAAQGQTVMVATGDDGADGCVDGRGRSVNTLASDPNVTAVGGTSLDPGFDPSGNATGFVSESVWNDRQGSSGGGVSTLVEKPAYQDAPGVPADGFRDQPDVSLVASPRTPGYVIIVEGAVAIVGGTSVAAPAWAGIAALLSQAAGARGLGALNPSLYALGRRQYAENGTAVFHDVTVGNNDFNAVAGYAAGPGFDLASGLGSPDVDRLAHALICTGDCNGDGAVTVDELLVGVNIALEILPLSRCPSFDSNGDGAVTLEELIQATLRALESC